MVLPSPSQELLTREDLLRGQEPLARLNLLMGQKPLARYFGNCWLQQLAALLRIPALIFYFGIAHKFCVSVILFGSSASCFWDKLYFTCFDERLFGSSASKSIHLVSLRIGSRLGSFVGLLIGCRNRVKWMTQTWFPATKLRAFVWLAKRKSADSTKNFERAIIAFNPFLFNASINFLNAVSVQFACVT